MKVANIRLQSTRFFLPEALADAQKSGRLQPFFVRCNRNKPIAPIKNY